MISNTPKVPYYAVIFTSVKTEDTFGYDEMSFKMIELVKKQEGFLGMESVRNDIGITISYWESMGAIKKWKHNLEHIEAREKGRSLWYKKFKVRICKVEKDYGFKK
jgi:heme-degrading monooxygenase HmoA